MTDPNPGPNPSPNPGEGRSFFSELRRRQVIRTCFLYILICWGIVQILEILAPPLGFDSDLVIRLFLIASVLGFPLAALLAWFYRLTGSGVERTEAFVERRVLNNIPPINDRRKGNTGGLFSKKKEPPHYDWILSIETGPLAGLSFGVHEPILLGRALECDIAIVSPHISRQHARLTLEGDDLFVEDMGSSNGTIVNGKKLSERRKLFHDDEVRLHDIVMHISENLNRPFSERQSTNETTFVHPDQSD